MKKPIRIFLVVLLLFATLIQSFLSFSMYIFKDNIGLFGFFHALFIHLIIIIPFFIFSIHYLKTKNDTDDTSHYIYLLILSLIIHNIYYPYIIIKTFLGIL